MVSFCQDLPTHEDFEQFLADDYARQEPISMYFDDCPHTRFYISLNAFNN